MTTFKIRLSIEIQSFSTKNNWKKILLPNYNNKKKSKKAIPFMMVALHIKAHSFVSFLLIYSCLLIHESYGKNNILQSCKKSLNLTRIEIKWKNYVSWICCCCYFSNAAAALHSIFFLLSFLFITQNSRFGCVFGRMKEEEEI